MTSRSARTMRSHPRRVTYRDAAQADLDRRRARRMAARGHRPSLDAQPLAADHRNMATGRDFSSRMAALVAAYEENRP
jgi:hypothetical protein